MERISPCLPKASAMLHAKISTTVVRSAMARFESTCSTPTLASKAVAAAKAADSRAHPIQLIGSSYAARTALKVKDYIFSSIRNDSLLLASRPWSHVEQPAPRLQRPCMV